jgi:hypothetical protein
VKLNELSDTGRKALRATDPVAKKLLPVARLLPETSRLTRQLNESIKARGVVEGLESFVYYATAATSRFDRFSHILPSYQIVGSCQLYATTPVDGCSARFTGGGAAAKQKAQKKTAKRKGRARRHHHRGRHAPQPDAPAAPQQAPPATPGQAPLPTPTLPQLPQVPPLDDVQHVLDYLLGP